MESACALHYSLAGSLRSHDSKPATASYSEFIMGENRYAALKQQFPEVASELFVRAEQEAKDKYDYYKKLNDME